MGVTAEVSDPRRGELLSAASSHNPCLCAVPAYTNDKHKVAFIGLQRKAWAEKGGQWEPINPDPRTFRDPNLLAQLAKEGWIAATTAMAEGELASTAWHAAALRYNLDPTNLCKLWLAPRAASSRRQQAEAGITTLSTPTSRKRARTGAAILSSRLSPTPLLSSSGAPAGGNSGPLTSYASASHDAPQHTSEFALPAPFEDFPRMTYYRTRATALQSPLGQWLAVLFSDTIPPFNPTDLQGYLNLVRSLYNYLPVLARKAHGAEVMLGHNAPEGPSDRPWVVHLPGQASAAAASSSSLSGAQGHDSFGAEVYMMREEMRALQSQLASVRLASSPRPAQTGDAEDLQAEIDDLKEYIVYLAHQLSRAKQPVSQAETRHRLHRASSQIFYWPPARPSAPIKRPRTAPRAGDYSLLDLTNPVIPHVRSFFS